jgi:hypothetical protein
VRFGDVKGVNLNVAQPAEVRGKDAAQGTATDNAELDRHENVCE